MTTYFDEAVPRRCPEVLVVGVGERSSAPTSGSPPDRLQALHPADPQPGDTTTRKDADTAGVQPAANRAPGPDPHAHSLDPHAHSLIVTVP